MVLGRLWGLGAIVCAAVPDTNRLKTVPFLDALDEDLNAIVPCQILVAETGDLSSPVAPASAATGPGMPSTAAPPNSWQKLALFWGGGRYTPRVRTSHSSASLYLQPRRFTLAARSRESRSLNSAEPPFFFPNQFLLPHTPPRARR